MSLTSSRRRACRVRFSTFAAAREKERLDEASIVCIFASVDNSGERETKRDREVRGCSLQIGDSVPIFDKTARHVGSITFCKPWSITIIWNCMHLQEVVMVL